MADVSGIERIHHGERWGVLFMHGFSGGWATFLLGVFGVVFCMYVWWRDITREATFEGWHTNIVQLGMRYGMVLFITSEVMFFFAFFWAFFHSSMAPTVEIGTVWPPKGLKCYRHGKFLC